MPDSDLAVAVAAARAGQRARATVRYGWSTVKLQGVLLEDDFGDLRLGTHYIRGADGHANSNLTAFRVLPDVAPDPEPETPCTCAPCRADACNIPGTLHGFTISNTSDPEPETPPRATSAPKPYRGHAIWRTDPEPEAPLYDEMCHCGVPALQGAEGRGMCEHCDSYRCDAYPGNCDRSHRPMPSMDDVYREKFATDHWLVPKVPDDEPLLDEMLLLAPGNLTPDEHRDIAALSLARADAIDAATRAQAHSSDITAEELADRILGAAFERGSTDPLLIAKGLLAEFNVTRREQS